MEARPVFNSVYFFDLNDLTDFFNLYVLSGRDLLIDWHFPQNKGDKNEIFTKMFFSSPQEKWWCLTSVQGKIYFPAFEISFFFEKDSISLVCSGIIAERSRVSFWQIDSWSGSWVRIPARDGELSWNHIACFYMWQKILMCIINSIFTRSICYVL